MEKDLISIIIPIYNSEKFLIRCLNSILKQVYENYEVILIDDGSYDNSSNICKNFCKKDKRFKYFYNKNQGVAKTRNFGIKKCNGKYITFIDSDDYISSYYLSILYKNLTINKCDVSVCLAKNVYNTIPTNKIKKQKNKIFSSKEAINNMLLEGEIDTSFWGKMYKLSLFNNIEINDYKMFEDLDTMYKIFLKSSNICFVYEELYFYYIRIDSLSHKSFSLDNMLVLKILDDLEKNVLKIYPDLSDSILIRKMNANFYIIRNTNKKDINNIKSKEFIKFHRKYVLKNKRIKMKLFLGICISYINIELIKPIYNFNNFLKKMIFLVRKR